jgi:hypothetical protein
MQIWPTTKQRKPVLKCKNNEFPNIDKSLNKLNIFPIFEKIKRFVQITSYLEHFLQISMTKNFC